MPATPIVTSNRIVIRHPKAVCYVADALREADFVEVPYLRCDRLRMVCGPEIDQCQLSYTYGDIVREDMGTLAYYPPLSLAGKFVKVMIADTIYEDDFADDPDTDTEDLPIVWYGRIEHDEKQSAGTYDSPVTVSSSSSSASAVEPHARGLQMMTAFGLLRLLEQEIIDTSYIDVPAVSSSSSSSSSVSGVPGLYVANTGLAFNSDPGGQFVRRGNRSVNKVDGSYVFDWQPRGAFTWSAYDAVEYLLTRQIPASDAGPLPTYTNAWRLESDEDYLSWFDIDVKTNGRTVKSVIDELIPRQRAVGNWVEFDPDTDEVVLSVFTFTDVDIALPTGAIIKANPEQRSLDFEHALDVTTATVTDTMVTRYHRVITRGEKRTTTFTARLAADPSLTAIIHAAWDPSDEAVYIAGASATAGYADLSTEEQQKRNAIVRSSPKLEEVWRRFKLNCNVDTDRWNCLIPDPLGSVSTKYLLRGDQSIDPYSAVWSSGTADGDYIPALRIHRALPLYEAFDYSGTNLSSFSYGSAFSANKHPSFLPPFVFVHTGFAPSTSSSSSSSAESSRRFEMLDRLNRAWAAAGDRTWSARISVTDTEPGIEIHASIPHFISGVGASGWGAMADHENHTLNKGIAYTDCYATICVELTEQVQWEEVLSFPPEDAPEQVLILPVPGARFDYVLPYTVVDIKDGVAVQTTSGGFAKNDMLRLRDMGRAAAQWYSKDRKTLDLGFKQVRGILKLGWLITDIGPQYNGAGLTAINTPVTGITYVLANGENGGSTQLETGFVNLDFSDVGGTR